jgi:hypothetical protein
MQYGNHEVKAYQDELHKLRRRFVADDDHLGSLNAWEKYIQDHGSAGLWAFFTSPANAPKASTGGTYRPVD